MTDIPDIWKRINDALDEDENADMGAFGELPGNNKDDAWESVSSAAHELLQQTFNADELPADLKLSKYRIIERLDEGGQSEIYLAERADGLYEETVVIKYMSSLQARDIVKEQFLQEMQLLADLKHPGIVQILDAGLSDEGHPWLVLEHVQGQHLNLYCQQNQLDNNDIVRLFVKLCDALGYVHLSGVFHMDLKPGNVLVKDFDGVAYPVLIDFGISMLAESAHSEEGVPLFGTPGFSAPEQMAGQQVDATADVYALGMMLAQILSSDAVDNIGSLSRRDRENYLAKAQTPKDLVQVVRRCTEEDPENRYASMDALRQDLNNWLLGQPLIANRKRFGHVVWRTIQRHKLASFMTLLIVVGAIAATYKYTSDISGLQKVTQAEKNSADALSNFMLTDLFEKLTQIGRIDLLQIIAEQNISHLQQQDSRTFDNESYLQSAKAYSNAGRVLDALKLTTPALEAFDKSEQQLQVISELPQYRQRYLRQLSNTKLLKGLSLANQGEQQQTETELLQALQLADLLQKEFPDEIPDLNWEAHTQLGWHYMEYDQPDEALVHIDMSRDIAAEVAAESGDMQWVLNQSHAWQAYTWYAFDYLDGDQARVAMSQALDFAKTTLTQSDDNIEYWDNYRILLNQQSFIQMDLGLVSSAQDSVDQAIEVGSRLALMAPQNGEYQRELAYSFTTGGEIAELQGDLDKALAFYQQSLEISRRIAQADKGGSSAANDYAIDLVKTAGILNETGHAEQAQNYWQQAVGIMEPVHKKEPDNKYYMQTLATPLIELGQYDRARPLIEAIKASGMDDQEFLNLLDRHQLD
jgi:serine/threonine protein kinase